VYKRDREVIIGMLLIKKLLQYGSDEDTKLSEVELKRIPEVSPQLPLYSLLNIFQSGKSHMAIVLSEESRKPIGIVTLEDLIEEILQEDIKDETQHPTPIDTNEESEEETLKQSVRIKIDRSIPSIHTLSFDSQKLDKSKEIKTPTKPELNKNQESSSDTESDKGVKLDDD